MGLRLPLPRIAGALVTGALAGLLAMGKGRRRRSWQRVRDAFGLLRSGNGRRVWRAVRIRAYSRSLSFGLRRDLRVPFTPPNPKIPLTMRPLGPQDDLAFLAPAAGLDQQAAWGRLNQRRLLADDLPTCWIATGPDGKVCYMQWLVAQGLREGRLRSLRRAPRDVVPVSPAHPVCAGRECYRSSEPQYAHLTALSGIVDRQNGHSFVVAWGAT